MRWFGWWTLGAGTGAEGTGFAKAQRLGTPPYDPGDLLRLYIWGYLSANRSSRALERECHRSVECMWLLERLVPDHKRIAQFRRQNAAALVASCAAFMQLQQPCTVVANAGYADGGHIAALDAQGITNQLRGGQPLGEPPRRGQPVPAQRLYLGPGQRQLHLPGGPAIRLAPHARRGAAGQREQAGRSAWMMALRRQTVEHPLASINHLILGNAQLLMRHTSGARTVQSGCDGLQPEAGVQHEGSPWMLQALRG